MGKVGTEATLLEILAKLNDIEQGVQAQTDLSYLAMLNAENYRAVMARWFLANGSSVMVDLTALCDRWYNITRQGWTGGVRFDQPAEGQPASSTGSKTGSNTGLSCTPSTTIVAGQDDYAGIPLFVPTDCNVYLDSDGRPRISAIDGIAGPVFKRSDPTAIVGVLQMTGWVRWIEEAGSYGFDYTDVIGADGFAPLPEAVELVDNSVRSWVVHGKYGFGEGWTCCSGQKTKVWNVSHNSQISGVRSVWGNRYCGFTAADDAFLKLMLYIKYGRLDSDGVLHGCVSYNYDYTPALAETGVERILLTPAQAANLVVGSAVCYGPTARAINSPVDRAKITAIETVEIDGTEYGAVYVDNGGVTFDTSTTDHLTTMQWHTGSTDGVLGNDGGINPLSDKFAVKLQGIEILTGCYEAAGDTIFRYEESGGVQCEVAHVCRDASKISTGITADYKTCAYGTPCPASSSWQYPKRLGHDAALPEVMLGSVLGGSTSSGPRDGQYIEAYSAGTLREWLRWGSLNNGLGLGGLSCCGGFNGLGTATWPLGGRLSVTGNRGEYQAAA